MSLPEGAVPSMLIDFGVAGESATEAAAWLQQFIDQARESRDRLNEDERNLRKQLDDIGKRRAKLNKYDAMLATLHRRVAPDYSDVWPRS